jgi:hypothetical protein
VNISQLKLRSEKLDDDDDDINNNNNNNNNPPTVTKQQRGVWNGGRERSASIDHTAAVLPAERLKGPPSRVLRKGERVERGQSATSCLAACWQHTLPELATANTSLESVVELCAYQANLPKCNYKLQKK